MVASITTLGTPHNGTLQIKLARKLVKETINRRLSGGKDVDIDLGFLNGD